MKVALAMKGHGARYHESHYRLTAENICWNRSLTYKIGFYDE